MAQSYASGACHLFAGGPPGGKSGSLIAPGSYLYLGTAENTPNIRLLPDYEPVMNDLAGQRKSYDRTYQGTDAMVSATLTRWNETVYSFLAGLPQGAARGTEPQGAIGTLEILEGAAFPLFLEFSYGVGGRAAKAAMAAAMGNGAGGPLPGGYLFYAAQLESHDRPKLGTGYSQLALSFFCGRIFTPADGSFVCYTTDTTKLPVGLPIN